MPTCGSPWLFAAYRVLRRQSVPWHPPRALSRLIFASLRLPAVLRLPGRETRLSSLLPLCSFQGALEFSLSRSLKTIQKPSEAFLRFRQLSSRLSPPCRSFAFASPAPALSPALLPLSTRSPLGARASCGRPWDSLQFRLPPSPSHLSLERR